MTPDYQTLHLRRWQAGSIENWEAECLKQGYGKQQLAQAKVLIAKYTAKGINELQAREDALNNTSWQSSGQF